MKWLRTWGPITSEPLYSLQLLRQGLSSVQGPRTVGIQLMRKVQRHGWNGVRPRPAELSLRAGTLWGSMGL